MLQVPDPPAAAIPGYLVFDTRTIPNGAYTLTCTVYYHAAGATAAQSVSTTYPTPVTVRNR